MKRWLKSRIILMFSLILVTTTVNVAQMPENFKAYDGLKEQFLIDLPEGWVAYDQTKVLMGKSSPYGVVVFSQIDFSAMETEKQLESMGKIDKGEIPSFFVDRHPKTKKMSCNFFEKKEKEEVFKMLKKDAMFGKDRKVIKDLAADTVSIGECKGLRIRGETQKSDGTIWVMDVHAVSDGEILYLFSLRNIKENYGNNLDVYEKAIATLKLTSVK